MILLIIFKRFLNQDSLDHCSMPIKIKKRNPIPINADCCPSMPINFSDGEIYLCVPPSYSIAFTNDSRSFDQYWVALIDISQWSRESCSMHWPVKSRYQSPAMVVDHVDRQYLSPSPGHYALNTGVVVLTNHSALFPDQSMIHWCIWVSFLWGQGPWPLEYY